MAVRIESQAEPITGYRLIERLGGGGFGDVWKVEAPGGLFKAMKFVYGDLKTTGEGGERAAQELKAMSRVKTVRHPYLLNLEQVQVVDGQLMIVMELADRNLWDRYRECRSQGLPGTPRDELLRYMEETAEALDLMNNYYQIQHLDIKPQNLFLVFNHVKVGDFGLAKLLEKERATVTGGVTPVYAAPETFEGYVSRFSDQYSLAIVFQELLTGARPFTGANVRQLVLQHMQATPDVSALPADDQPIILRALSKHPDDRHPTCESMITALRRGSVPATHADSEIVDDSTPCAAAGNTLTANPGLAAAEQSESCLDAPPSLGAQESRVWATECLGTPGDSAHRGDDAFPVRSAPQPVQGDGELFPALIVGIGCQGLSVLQGLRQDLVQRFGSLDAIGNLRLLFLDTDPEVIRQAGRGAGGSALAGNEILLTRLNRPSYYLKPRKGRSSLMDKWFNPKMLYCIPRSQVTTGLRAL